MTLQEHLKKANQKSVQRRREVKEFRMRTVLSLHEQGCSNRKIAETLGVTVSTVTRLKREMFA